MALKRYEIDGYGQIEINNCAFRRDGRIEAQCAPDATLADTMIENGMILAVDAASGVVKYSTDDILPVALVYTTEHMYDERTPGLKNFALKGKDDFLPRLGYLAVGDKFTTNCICYDTDTFANEEAVNKALEAIGTTPVYGQKSSIGAICLTSTLPTEGPVLKVAKVYTMPDGQFGLKFQVISC